MNNFGSSVCSCSDKIENYDEKFVKHLNTAMSMVLSARDDDKFCAMSVLLVLDMARLMVIRMADINPGEQVISAQDTMRLYDDLEEVIMGGGERAVH